MAIACSGGHASNTKTVNCTICKAKNLSMGVPPDNCPAFNASDFVHDSRNVSRCDPWLHLAVGSLFMPSPNTAPHGLRMLSMVGMSALLWIPIAATASGCGTQVQSESAILSRGFQPKSTYPVIHPLTSSQPVCRTLPLPLPCSIPPLGLPLPHSLQPTKLLSSSSLKFSHRLAGLTPLPLLPSCVAPFHH